MGLIKNFENLATTPQRKIVLELIEAGLDAIQPEVVFKKNVSLEGATLHILDSKYDLKEYEHIYLIGFGKGSGKNAKLLEDLLGEKLTEGYVIDTTPQEFARINFTLGTHPLPSQTNLDFTKSVVDRFENKVSEKDLILVVVAGGGSVLFELPASRQGGPESLSLDELIKKDDELLKSGLTISQMNDERKKLSRVKAGGLARILYPAKVVGLIFSDVPGNDISVVASGPTDEENAENILVLSNKTALLAMEEKAREFGINARIYSDSFQSEAKTAGQKLIEQTQPDEILLVGGETTVHVTGNGKGGRNLEVVLGALPYLDEKTVIASFDSDGWDNCESAGAIGDFQTVENAKNQSLNIEDHLKNNNSFDFFEKTNDAIITGRLPSNISDLIIVYKS